MAFNSDVANLKAAIFYLSDCESLAWENLIDEQVIGVREISSVLDFRDGVKQNEKIGFVDSTQGWDFMKDASSLPSNCDDIPCDVGVTTSTKTWMPNPYKCSIENCFKDIDPFIRDYYNSYKDDREMTENSAYVNYIVSLMEQAIRKSHWTKAYFGDAASTDNSLSGINGLFNQYTAYAPTADVASTSGYVQRTAMSANAGADYAAQTYDRTTNDIIDDITAHFDAVESNRYLNGSGYRTKITRATALAYLQWLRENKQVNCCERDPQTGTFSLDSLTFFGRPLEIMDEWDQIIDFTPFQLNNGTRRVNPHRIVTSVRANEPIGSCYVNRLGEVRYKYDEYKEQFKIVAEYDMDVKILREELFVLSM